ncbi:MAG: hypothetical protein V1820_04015 [archaeon]
MVPALGEEVKRVASELFEGAGISIGEVKAARTANTTGPGYDYWFGLNATTQNPRLFEDAAGTYDYEHTKKNLMRTIWGPKGSKEMSPLEAAARRESGKDGFPQIDPKDSLTFYIDVDCDSPRVSGICKFPMEDFPCDLHPIDELGEGLLKACATKYGLPYFLRRGPKIIISPDVITPELFEAIGEGPKSLVVIGAGAGTDAYMAKLLGYDRVTVIDLSSTVAKFHEEEFSGKFPHFKMVRANAMDPVVGEILSSEKPDVVTLATNYEVNPFAIRALGKLLENNVGALAVLPNLPNYFTEFGDAVAGGGRWPFGPDARLSKYFGNIADVWYHYERGLVASKDPGTVSRVEAHFADAPRPENLL